MQTVLYIIVFSTIFLSTLCMRTVEVGLSADHFFNVTADLHATSQLHTTSELHATAPLSPCNLPPAE